MPACLPRWLTTVSPHQIKRGRGKNPRASALSHRAKNFLDDIAGGAQRILAQRFFLLAYHEIKFVQRFARDVAFDGGVVFLNESQRCTLTGERVILLREADFIRGCFHDGEKPLRELSAGSALEVVGDRSLTTGEYAFRV